MSVHHQVKTVKNLTNSYSVVAYLQRIKDRLDDWVSKLKTEKEVNDFIAVRGQVPEECYDKRHGKDVQEFIVSEVRKYDSEAWKDTIMGWNFGSSSDPKSIEYLEKEQHYFVVEFDERNISLFKKRWNCIWPKDKLAKLACGLSSV